MQRIARQYQVARGKGLSLGRAILSPARLKEVLSILIMTGIVAGSVLYPGNSAHAATYTFVQTSWAGGETANAASHGTDQTGWTEYSAADAGMSAGTSLTITPTASTTVHTSSAQFGGGTNSQTVISGSGDGASVALAVSSATWSQTNDAFLNQFISANMLSHVIGDDGFARLAYNNGGGLDLYYARCTDSACTSPVFTEVSTDLSSTSGYPDITIGTDGYARIAYYNNTADLKYVQCTNDNCTAKNITVLDTTGDTGKFPSIDIGSDGYARIAYYDATNGDLKLARCTDNSCSSPSIATIDSTDNVGTYPVVRMGTDGFPRIFYGDVTNARGKFMQCLDADCSSTNITVISTGSLAFGDYSNAMELGSDGLPRLLYSLNQGGRKVTLGICSNADCSSRSTVVTETHGFLGASMGLALTSNDNPHVAYNNSSGVLTVLDCSNTSCSSYTTTSIAFSGDSGFGDARPTRLAVTSDDLLRIATRGENYFYQVPTYYSSGTYTSGVVDLASTPDFSTLEWTETLNSGDVQIKLAHSDNGSTFSSFLGPDGTTGTSFTTSSGEAIPAAFDGKRYIKYQISLTTADTGSTPLLSDITLNYSVYETQTLTSSIYDTSDAAAILSQIEWNEDASVPTGTEVRFQMKSAATSGGLSGASFVGPDGTTGTYFKTGASGCSKADTTVTCSISSGISLGDGSNDRYFQYQVSLYISTGSASPTLSDVTVTYVVNAPPDFDATFGTNGVSVSQISDSGDANWGKVQIQYKVRDIDTTQGTFTPNVITPSFEYSLNDGSSWNTLASENLASGDTDTKSVAEGSYTTHTATWDVKTHLGQIYNTTMKIRVTVDDGEAANNTTSATGGTFTVDTLDPYVESSTIDSVNNTVNFSGSDHSSYEYRFSNNSDFSSDGVNATSGQWQSATGTSTPSVAWTLTGAPSTETVYFEIRDAYGNSNDGVALVAPVTPSGMNFKDISNPTAGTYREFVSWDVYSATTSAAFGSYKVYRSTDDATYSLVSTISTASENYYVDQTVATGTTYYYKVAFADSDGDLGNQSAAVSDTPDGQGGTDAVAPTISSVTVSSTASTQATITWTTDEISDSTVEYDTSGSYSLSKTVSSQVLSHSVTLTGLTPSTEYTFRVKSSDFEGNESTDDNSGAGYTFTTAGGPVISNVTAVAISDSTATIRWNTNIDSNSFVDYSLVSALTDTTTAGNAALVGGTASTTVFQHEVVLTGLDANTTYYYQVRSADASADETTDDNGGAAYSFVTTADTKAPTISNLSTPVVASNAAVVFWTTDELANSSVSYGTVSGTLDTSVATSTYTVDHAVSLSGLSAETKYYYTVTSADQAGNSATSDEGDFTTTEEGTTIVQTVVSGGGGGGVSVDRTPPTISIVEVEQIGAFGATIHVRTNEQAIAFVEYGETDEYGNVAGDGLYTTEKRMRLKGLKMGTEYHFKVKVFDRTGNETSSSDDTFTTQFAAEALEDLVTLENASQFQELLDQILESALPSLAPPFLDEPVVSDITETSATISWNTNVPAFSVIRFSDEDTYEELTAAEEIRYVQDATNLSEKTRNHEVVLEELRPSTRYHFQAESFSIPNVVGKAPDATFVTATSDIAPRAVSVGKESMTIAWETDVPATSVVSYRNQNTGEVNEKRTETFTRNHVVVLENLSLNTAYGITVSGVTQNGARLADQTLSVRTESDTDAPEVLTLRINSALVPGRTDRAQVVVGWQTDEPSQGAVLFGEGASTGGDLPNEIRDESPEYSLSHSVIIGTMRPGTLYRIVIRSTDQAGNTSDSPPRTIITPQESNTIFDVILDNFRNSFRFLQ